MKWIKKASKKEKYKKKKHSKEKIEAKFLAEEKEKSISIETTKIPEWFSIIFNTFFSTAHETIKQKET